MDTDAEDPTGWDREVQHLLLHGRDLEASETAIRNLRDGPPTPTPPIEQLDQVAAVLGTVAGTIRADQLDAPTPCAGFAVRDVLGHMIGGATLFAAAFRGQAAPALVGDPAAGPDVVAHAGVALGELIAAVHGPGALDRTITTPFGEVPGDTLVRYLAVDGLVHGWDISTATDQPYEPPDDLVAAADAFARRFIADAWRDGDAFAAATHPPEGATSIERLAAFTGRNV